MRSILRPLVVSLFLAAPLSLLAKARDVEVEVELTLEGKKLPLPTKDAPTFYYPVVAGYSIQGDPINGEKVPPEVPLLQQVAKALFARNYEFATGRTPPPTQVLMIGWGYINPIQNPTKGLATKQMSEAERRGQTGWTTMNNQRDPKFAADDSGLDQTGQYMDTDSHYFLLVSAYDFSAFQKEKKKVLLWRAKMTAPTPGTTLEEVIPEMLAKGTAIFGTDGKVTIGTPTVVSDVAAKPAVDQKKP